MYIKTFFFIEDLNPFKEFVGLGTGHMKLSPKLAIKENYILAPFHVSYYIIIILPE
jgi:hypothetical protein